MKRFITLAFVALSALAITGCQIPGKVVDTQRSLACPTCESVTKTTPLKGITYDTMTCPKCQTTTTGAWQYEQEYTQKMHYCSTCKTKVATCPVCASER